MTFFESYNRYKVFVNKMRILMNHSVASNSFSLYFSTNLCIHRMPNYELSKTLPETIATYLPSNVSCY